MINHEKMKKYLRQSEFSALEFSKDDSSKVCAIILNKEDFTPRTWGYNGMPRGANDKLPERWVRPEKYKWVEHAERNAIANAAKVGTPLEGTTIIVNMFPCLECARMIVQSGIKHVVAIAPDMTKERDMRWADEYRRSEELFQECGVELHTFPEKDLNLEPIRAMFKPDNTLENSQTATGVDKENNTEIGASEAQDTYLGTRIRVANKMR